jgi:ABC-type multidrug transport system permease subunit
VAFSPRLTAAAQVGMGTFFPSLMLSGIIWPLEGMTWWLRYVAYCLPTTWAAESMRSVMLRGWGIEKEHVWAGFVAVAGYIALFSALATFRVRNVD